MIIETTTAAHRRQAAAAQDRKSTRLNSSHTVIYTLSLHDALPICAKLTTPDAAMRHHWEWPHDHRNNNRCAPQAGCCGTRSEEHTSELQSHRDLHSFPTRRSSDLRKADNSGRSDETPLGVAA